MLRSLTYYIIVILIKYCFYIDFFIEIIRDFDELIFLLVIYYCDVWDWLWYFKGVIGRLWGDFSVININCV